MGSDPGGFIERDEANRSRARQDRRIRDLERELSGAKETIELLQDGEFVKGQLQAAKDIRDGNLIPGDKLDAYEVIKAVAETECAAKREALSQVEDALNSGLAMEGRYHEKRKEVEALRRAANHAIRHWRSGHHGPNAQSTADAMVRLAKVAAGEGEVQSKSEIKRQNVMKGKPLWDGIEGAQGE